jgi:hypothetical protein
MILIESDWDNEDIGQIIIFRLEISVTNFNRQTFKSYKISYTTAIAKLRYDADSCKCKELEFSSFLPI